MARTKDPKIRRDIEAMMDRMSYWEMSKIIGLNPTTIGYYVRDIKKDREKKEEKVA